jgi:shikimate kinase
LTATRNNRTPEQVRADIEQEREQLASAVEDLRDSLGEATNIAAKVKAKLPLAAGAAATVGFVVAGGVGATMRYFARRGREGSEKARAGRWSLFDRD